VEGSSFTEPVGYPERQRELSERLAKLAGTKQRKRGCGCSGRCLECSSPVYHSLRTVTLPLVPTSHLIVISYDWRHKYPKRRRPSRTEDCENAVYKRLKTRILNCFTGNRAVSDKWLIKILFNF